MVFSIAVFIGADTTSSDNVYRRRQNVINALKTIQSNLYVSKVVLKVQTLNLTSEASISIR